MNKPTTKKTKAKAEKDYTIKKNKYGYFEVTLTNYNRSMTVQGGKATEAKLRCKEWALRQLAELEPQK